MDLLDTKVASTVSQSGWRVAIGGILGFVGEFEWVGSLSQSLSNSRPNGYGTACWGCAVPFVREEEQDSSTEEMGK